MSDTPDTSGTPAAPASSVPPGPVLVTGATGLVGHHLCRRLSVSRRVLAVSRTLPALHAPRGLGPAAARLVDIRDADALAALLDTAEPAAVVHLAALARPDACERDPEGSRAVNLEASAALAGLCATRGVRLAFASTDLVFGGDPGNDGPPYHETAAPAPVCVYGAHKA
ncbi:MAG: sugar nucleotide-binding protein, partial [Desulfovibrionaceae bacterium]